MNNTDRLVLDALKPYMTEVGYVLVMSKVGKAGSIANLRDSVAIAELEMAKRKFGNRSEAGRYAAEIRWAKGQAANSLIAPKVEGGGGGEIRVGMQDGQAVEFQVVSKPVGEVIVGDLVSSGDNTPHKVTDIVSMDRNTTTFVLESVDGRKQWSKVTTSKNSEIDVWNKAGKSTGKPNASRLVDRAKLQPRDIAYIDGGKSGPERVKRRNEVLDWYAKQGIDVSKPAAPKRQGGKQWLEFGQ